MSRVQGKVKNDLTILHGLVDQSIQPTNFLIT